MFPAVFNVNSLNGTNGFIINGVTPSDGSGSGVERAGDINGDGLDDVIIQAPYSGGVGQNYVVFGNKNGFSNPFNLSSLNGTNGFTINGVINSNGINSIEIIENIGDIKGDNIYNLGITAASIPNNVLAQSYAVYGQGYITPTTTPIPSSIPSPGPHNLPESNADIGAIVGGTVGGVVFLGLIGLALWYGKTHGWCSGEHGHGGEYTSV